MLIINIIQIRGAIQNQIRVLTAIGNLFQYIVARAKHNYAHKTHIK